MTSNIINASVPFLLLPFLTYNLTTIQFGLISLFTTLSGFLSPIIGLNSEGSIMVNFSNQHVKKDIYIWNCILISICSFLISLLIILLFKGYLSNITSLPVNWIILAILITFFKFQVDLLLSIKQSFGHSLQFGIIQISNSILNVVLTIFLVQNLESKVEGRLYAILISTVIISLFSWIHLKRGNLILIKIRKKYIISILKFGIGLIPHSIGGLLLILANRFIVADIIGIEAAGIYSLASQLALIIGFITLSFNNAYVPWLYSKLSTIKNDIEEKIKIIRMTYIYFLSLLIFTLLYVILSPLFFSLLIDDKFKKAYELFPFIAIGFWFQGLYFMVVNYIIYRKKTLIQSGITIITGLISIIFTYILTYKYGLMGTSISFALSYFLLFTFTWILSNRLFPMPWFDPLLLSKK